MVAARTGCSMSCSENTTSFNIAFCQTPVGLSTFSVCLEGLRVDNPELAAPSPKEKNRDRKGCDTYTSGTHNRFLIVSGLNILYVPGPNMSRVRRFPAKIPDISIESLDES